MKSTSPSSSTTNAAAETNIRELEARHRLLVESWAQAIWETDASGVVVTDSPSWRAYTGQTADEWLGHGWLGAIHPDDRLDAEQQWRDSITARQLVNAEVRLSAPGGGWRWTNVRAAPVLDASGSIEKWAGLNIDIDNRKRAEVDLRDSEAKYRSLFNNMAEGLTVCGVVRDGSGQVVDQIYLDLNPAVERQLGVPRDVFVGRRLSEIAPKGDFESWMPIYSRVADTGEPVMTENYSELTNRWYEMSLYRSVQDQVIVFSRDISERKHAEQMLRESEVRQAFLLKLSDILQRQSAERDIKAAATQMLGEHLQVSRVQYHEVDSSGEYYDADGIGFAVGIPLLTDRYRIAQFGSFVGEDFEAGRPFRSDDLWVDPRPSDQEREAYQAFSIRAGAGTPLLRRGKLVAILAVHDIHPHAWTDLEMDLIRETTERIWAAVERSRAEQAIRASEERQVLLLRLADALRPITDPAALKLKAVRLIQDHLRAGNAHYYDEDELSALRSLGGFVLAGLEAGEPVVVRDTLTDWRVGGMEHRSTPSLRYRALLAIPRTDGGKLVGAVALMEPAPRDWTREDIELVDDVAERTRAALQRARSDAALRESEERFQQFAAASSSALWIRDAATLDMEYSSPAIRTIYGLAPEELLGDVRRWAALIIPEDREVALQHLMEAGRGEPEVFEFRIHQPEDGFRWIRSTDFPLFDEHGRITRIGGLAEDVTETKKLAQHQTVLLHELQHRVRNIMALIRSITERTAERSVSVEDYRARLQGRLLALARVQALLTQRANAGGSLRELIETEVHAQAHHTGQLEVTGADLILSPKAVEVLTLAFHELATNALKYGALSKQDGVVRVEWNTRSNEGQSWLALDWTEEGTSQPPVPATRRGFGSELIEGRIPYELGGRGELRIEQSGAHCHFEFPLTGSESILKTDAPSPTRIFGGSLDMTGAPDLSGHKVLVVEDDYFAAADVASAFRGAGAQVLGPCPNEEQTRRLLNLERPTAAVLDLNLGGGGPRFEIAHLLRSKNVPIVFLTGYDPEVIPEEFASVVRLQKPIPFRDVVEAVSGLR